MRAVLAALAANLGIAATKLAAALITGSASMLAESVHSIADSGNQVLLLVGRSRSRRAETEAHQFGFGTERYFYGFVVAVVLFTVGALFSIYQGWHRITHPEEVVSPLVALAVLGVAIILESVSLRTALAASNTARGGLSLGHFIRHAKAPELPTVLLEDLGGAGRAGVRAGRRHAERDHPAAGMGRPGLAGDRRAARRGGHCPRGQDEEPADRRVGRPDVERLIVTALEDGPELQRVIHLRTVHLGPEALLVAAKVAIRGEQTGASIASGIDTAERRVRAAVPIAQIIYLEPDLYRAAEADETDPAIRAVLRDPAELTGPADAAGPAAPAGPPDAARPAGRPAPGQPRLPRVRPVSPPGVSPSSRSARSCSKSSARVTGPGSGPFAGRARLPGSAPPDRSSPAARTQAPRG